MASSKFRDSESVRLGQWLPAVEKWPVRRTSSDTDHYNCYAYVAGDTRRPWCPLPILPRGVHWPVPVDDEEENTVWPVLKGYEAIGFEWCENGTLENGFEKLALYTNQNDEPTHVAIQRENGTWQSKLGSDIDVEHALESLESSDEFGPTDYGKVRYFMKRKRTPSPTPY
jgi:hypothetical protein